MMSRLAFIRGTLFPSRCLLGSSYQSRLCTTAATDIAKRPAGKLVPSEEGPERDYVNYPPLTRNERGGKVRWFFLPDDWFNAFYSKTGVTGPYMLCIGLATYLCSKEIYVISPHTMEGIGLGITVYLLSRKIAPILAPMLDKEGEEYLQSLNDSKNSRTSACEEDIKNQEIAIDQCNAVETLLNAKRENIHLQLEAEYRSREMEAYSKVKNRLDYQLQVQNVKSRIEQEHMCDWITSNVTKSITPLLEQASLKKCFGDLKTLAAAASH